MDIKPILWMADLGYSTPHLYIVAWSVVVTVIKLLWNDDNDDDVDDDVIKFFEDL